MTHAHHDMHTGDTHTGDTHTGEGERLDQASPALATTTDHGTHHGDGHTGHSSTIATAAVSAV